MNYYQDEMTAEYNRQRIITDMEQIRLEKTAIQARGYKPGRLTHMMFNFANWLIATGQNLRKRYEIPMPNSNQAAPHRLAH